MSLLALLAQQRASGGGDVSGPPTLTLGGTLVQDGNSHYASWVYPPLDAVGDYGALMTATGTTHHNTAITGRKWRELVASPGSRDAYLPASSATPRVLVVGEWRNEALALVSENPGWTAQQVADRLVLLSRRYLSEAYVAGWDRLILSLSFPSEGVTSAATLNAGMALADQWWRDHWTEQAGLCGLADPRTYAPAHFGGDGLSQQGYMTSASTCLEADSSKGLYAPAGPWIHPAGAARAALAACVSAAISAAT